MVLSWNEIKDRAVKFSKEWAGTSNEEADAKPFLVEFFNVFGISNKRVATFEHRVKKLDDTDGYIDLLWKGMILVEMKSRGKNLDKAYIQAKNYLHGLKDFELPKYILVSDFENFHLYDLEENTIIDFTLNDLVNNVQYFAYLLGYQKKVYKEQDPANIKAAELMGKLHDQLEEIGYSGHSLEVYLVRLLFCLFAEDTTIFNKQQFQDYIEYRTQDDGSDLAARLQELFKVLNTPKEKRFKNLDEQLADFPYVNGKLFEENLPTASFDSKMRKALLNCCYLDWSKISPAIFGSMFQSVMNPQERRNLGAHYTSEKNILKLITPLFLDELRQEFNDIVASSSKGAARTKKLTEFHKKLRSLTFLDPACGCGNFLVITYRELRLLEIDVLRALYSKGTIVYDIANIIWVDVDQFYGIEYEEFPARIAEVAMWLIDHQMNMMVSNEFGQYFVRLPLKKSAHIVHGNALRIDWESVVSKNKLSYILGNPPFYGYSFQSKEQKNDLNLVFHNSNGIGVLDYVTAWYVKSAELIQKTNIKVAFVSTNSIVQGEQVAVLWEILSSKLNVTINFAYQTFVWNNEAKGNAAVHVVIIGFSYCKVKDKFLYKYNDIQELHRVQVKEINPYLIEGKTIFIHRRKSPLCSVPEMTKGSSPTDGGHLLLNEQEKQTLLEEHPHFGKYIKQYTGSFEYINNVKRYCLWLKDAPPEDLRRNLNVSERLLKVKNFRKNSPKVATQKWSQSPSLFVEERQPSSHYLIFPRVSSENRKYIPIGYLDKEIIISDSAIALPNATMFHFGILVSIMHMAWVKYICGRLKSDFRYSNTIVYNNFPWPENPTAKQIKTIEEKAQKVLDARAQFPNSSLADLYDPLAMPPALVKAHNELDKAVDLAYRSQPFTSEANRMEFLFELYEKYTANLFTEEKPKKAKKKEKV